MDPRIVEFLNGFGHEISKENQFDDCELTWDMVVTLMEQFANYIVENP